MRPDEETMTITAEETTTWSDQYQARALQLSKKDSLTAEEENEYKKSLFLAGLLDEVTDQLLGLDDDTQPETLN